MRIHLTLFGIILFSGITSVYAEIDDASLKAWLLQGFIGTECTHGITRPQLRYFRTHCSVSDEQLHRVLMAIYQDTDNMPKPVTSDAKKRDDIEAGVVYLLSECGNMPVKDFLLNYASSREKNPKAREFAVSSYLCVANAEESKNILLRFLVNDERMAPVSRNGIYCFARESYESSGSPEKKAAILAALTTAAEKEEDNAQFMQVDRILSEIDDGYRQSYKRGSMFNHHNMESPMTATWGFDIYTALGGMVLLFLLCYFAYVLWTKKK